MIFSVASTIWFSTERGFSESFYILCPICWNSGIKVVRWEDGTEEVNEYASCKRRDEAMN